MMVSSLKDQNTTLPTVSCNLHTINLPLMLRSSMRPISIKFSKHNFVYDVISPMCAIFSAISLLNLTILKLFAEQYRLRISPLCNIIQLVTSSNLGPSILPSSLFSNKHYFQDVARHSLGITSQKIVLLIITILKTSNPVLKYSLPLVREAKFTPIQNYQ